MLEMEGRRRSNSIALAHPKPTPPPRCSKPPLSPRHQWHGQQQDDLAVPKFQQKIVPKPPSRESKPSLTPQNQYAQKSPSQVGQQQNSQPRPYLSSAIRQSKSLPTLIQHEQQQLPSVSISSSHINTEPNTQNPTTPSTETLLLRIEELEIQLKTERTEARRMKANYESEIETRVKLEIELHRLRKRSDTLMLFVESLKHETQLLYRMALIQMKQHPDWPKWKDRFAEIEEYVMVSQQQFHQQLGYDALTQTSIKNQEPLTLLPPSLSHSKPPIHSISIPGSSSSSSGGGGGGKNNWKGKSKSTAKNTKDLLLSSIGKWKSSTTLPSATVILQRASPPQQQQQQQQNDNNGIKKGEKENGKESNKSRPHVSFATPTDQKEDKEEGDGNEDDDEDDEREQQSANVSVIGYPVKLDPRHPKHPQRIQRHRQHDLLRSFSVRYITKLENLDPPPSPSEETPSPAAPSVGDGSSEVKSHRSLKALSQSLRRQSRRGGGGVFIDQAKRDNIVKELVFTERNYVRDLEICMEVFYEKLGQLDLLSKSELQILFCNIPDLLQVNKILLIGLEREYSKEESAVQQFGKVFTSIARNLSVYGTYCANHPHSSALSQQLKRCNAAFVQFLNEVKVCEKEKTRNLDIGDFLIKPLQRICRYPLLVKEILKFTSELHPDYDYLVEAGVQVEMLLNDVNVRMIETEQNITNKQTETVI